MLKSTKNSAVKARTQTVNQMKALVVTAHAELREKLDGLGTSALVKRCGSFRPGRLDSPTAAAKYALRIACLSNRQLSKEIQDLRDETSAAHQDDGTGAGRSAHGRGSADRRRQQL